MAPFAKGVRSVIQYCERTAACGALAPSWLNSELLHAPAATQDVYKRQFENRGHGIPRSATGEANYAGDTGNVAGKRTNRGYEGLAVSPDGKYAYTMLQSAMLDEGGGDDTVNRIVKFDLASGKAVAQYAYQMKRANQGQGISSLVAINDHEFLVLERNNRGIGVGATFATADKEVYKIDIAGATAVSYTHLDVYKRQVGACIVSSEGGARPGTRPTGPRHLATTRRG